MKIYSKLILLALSGILEATTISGVGYGDLEKDAKKEALSDLANKISVDVKSDFKTITKIANKNYSKSKEKLVQLSSNLPLKGVEYNVLVGDRLIKTTATLDSKKALKVYQYEITKLRSNIAQALLTLENTKNKNLKYKILNQILKDIKNFEKFKTVAIVLGAKKVRNLNVTQSEILTQLQSYHISIPTIEIASEIFTKSISQKNIYISAIKPNGSHEVTQFAKVLKDNMRQHLKTTKHTTNASYFLRGSYEILSNSIFVTLNLSDKNNEIIRTITGTLKPSAYKNLHYKPTTKTFDNSLNTEFVKSGTLYTSIGFKGYDRANGIDLKQGDTVDIVLKTNKPMCYFLLGHVLKERESFSYVLPIGSDNTPFINFITGEDVNRQITIIDEIPVEAPFGSENLQLFASTFDKHSRCPLVVPPCEDDADGYCVVKGKPSKVVTKTRGLNMHKKKHKVQKSEASISWNSFKN